MAVLTWQRTFGVMINAMNMRIFLKTRIVENFSIRKGTCTIVNIHKPFLFQMNVVLTEKMKEIRSIAEIREDIGQIKVFVAITPYLRKVFLVLMYMLWQPSHATNVLEWQ